MISEIGLQKIKRAVWNKEETNCLLESNTLLLGATQTGKSTLADMMIGQVSRQGIGKAVIFEVKGERIKNIDDEDIFVSCSSIEGLNGREFIWSILKEATVFGKTDVERRIASIYEPLFRSKIKKSTQPYFIKAACNILTGLTYSLYLKYGLISNRLLFEMMEEMDVSGYYNLFSETGTIRRYARDIPIINGRVTGQAAGVLGELSHYISAFARIFKKDGYDSIYEFGASPGCERFFFLYDYNSREDCDLLYTILFNQIIAYKLSYTPIGSQKIYMFLDEISVIENSEIDLQFAANIGTSKGLHLIIAIQNIQLLSSIYGDDNVNAILEGFNNIVAFKVNQQETKNFIRNRVGMEVDTLLVSMPLSRKDKVTYQIGTGNQITDELIEGLNVGTAILKVGIQEPCIIKIECGEG